MNEILIELIGEWTDICGVPMSNECSLYCMHGGAYAWRSSLCFLT
jgi:hypothetical protein